MNSDAIDWTNSYGWYFDCHPARKLIRSSVALTAGIISNRLLPSWGRQAKKVSWKEILR